MLEILLPTYIGSGNGLVPSGNTITWANIDLDLFCHMA